MKTEPIYLQFYTKPDCPLCDEAKSVLQSLVAKAPRFEVEEIDITRNLGLFTTYKHLIPVLKMDGKRLSIHRIGRRQLLWQLRWHRLRKYLT